MSVPHLDTRVVDGSSHLLFGPYAGWTPKFLKHGSWFDLFGSIKPGNLGPMLSTAAHNMSLTKYLVSEVLRSKDSKFKDLLDFFPDAKPGDWDTITAGQRVQVIRPDGTLQFGTEVITGSEGTIAVCSVRPRAPRRPRRSCSSAQPLLPREGRGLAPTLSELVPTYGTKLGEDAALANETLTRTAKTLQISN